jgi:hypothetical protein
LRCVGESGRIWPRWGSFNPSTKFLSTTQSTPTIISITLFTPITIRLLLWGALGLLDVILQILDVIQERRHLSAVVRYLALVDLTFAGLHITAVQSGRLCTGYRTDVGKCSVILTTRSRVLRIGR